MSTERKKISDVFAGIDNFLEVGATQEDLVKLAESLVVVVTRERDKLQETIDTAKGEVNQAVTDAVAKLDRRLASLQTITDQLDRSGKDAETRASIRLANEVKRLEGKIPTRTDLSGIQAELKAIQEALVTVPTEITANPEAVRDALELLPDGNKLALDAVEGLVKELDELRKRPTGNVVGGPRLFRYLSDVNIEGITNGQVPVWNAATSKFLPGNASGGATAAEDVTFIPAGTIAATDVQAALEELDADIQALSAGAGISRTVVVTSGSITVGSAAATDYVYFVSGAHTMSLPAAAANTTRYTFKNNHSAAVTIDTVGAETIDGAASIQIAPEDAVDIISDGSNYYVV